MYRRPLITLVQCTYLNIFFSETTRLIEFKFYMEYTSDKTIYFVSGNLAKMGTVPIYCKKKPLKEFLAIRRVISLNETFVLFC